MNLPVDLFPVAHSSSGHEEGTTLYRWDEGNVTKGAKALSRLKAPKCGFDNVQHSQTKLWLPFCGIIIPGTSRGRLILYLKASSSPSKSTPESSSYEV